MKVFTANFHGYYPVGAAAVILAESKLEAEADLKYTLEQMGLAEKNPTISVKQITNPGVHVLCDGEY